MLENGAHSTDSQSELNRTQRSDEPISDFIWKNGVFARIGHTNLDMSSELLLFEPSMRESFKRNILRYANKGDYSPLVIMNFLLAFRLSLRRFPTTSFNEAWILNAMTQSTFSIHLGPLKNFFIYWQANDPYSICPESLQVLVKVKRCIRTTMNVLSDDPEKSWLTDAEYEAVVQATWKNFDESIFSTQQTLMIMLSLQYARRPIQLAHLKICDFRIANPGDSFGLSGYVVNFPGVKDISATKGFRDSKFELHPLPDHLWHLFELQREETRRLWSDVLDTRLSDNSLAKLPLFVSLGRISQAIDLLSDHYCVDWLKHIDHELYHLPSHAISKTLSWKPDGKTFLGPTPISHRTGQPLVLNATRMRHTRARQLARKGIPKHILSHWLGHTSEKSLKAYYNDPSEDARQLNEIMAPALLPLSMAFAGNLIDSADQASRAEDPTSNLEFVKDGVLKNVGNCGKHTFCATTSVPIPCYRCKHFEPLVTAPHEEVLLALNIRQNEENDALKIGGAKNLLIPIDLSADIRAVQNCIDLCNARKLAMGD